MFIIEDVTWRRGFNSLGGPFGIFLFVCLVSIPLIMFTKIMNGRMKMVLNPVICTLLSGRDMMMLMKLVGLPISTFESGIQLSSMIAAGSVVDTGAN